MPPKPTNSLQSALAASLKAAPWITNADQATVRLAEILVDDMLAADGRDRIAIAKQLNDVLASLGLTVSGRAGKPDQPKATEVNPLDEIRAKANRPATSTRPRAATKRAK